MNSGNGTQILIAETGGEGKPGFLSGGGTVFCPTQLYKRKEWVLLFIQFPGGAEAKAIFRAYGYTSKSWTHAEGATNSKAPKTTSGGEVIFGAGKEAGGNFRIAAFAQYATSFSQAEAEAFTSMATLEAMGSKSPVAFITFGQREVAQGIKDWSGGGATQSSQENSEVLEESPPIHYSAREQVTWLVTSSTLKASSLPATFTQLPWAVETGGWSLTEGWNGSYNAAATAGSNAGVYWNAGEIAGQGNAAAAVTWKNSSSLLTGRSHALWLYSAAGATPSGYQAQLVQSAEGSSKFSIRLRKWIAGSEILLKEVNSLTLESGGGFAIAGQGGKIFALLKKNESAEWAVVAEVSDTTYIKGFTGMDANGANPRLTNFATATIEGAAVTKGGTVKVLKNGSLVDAKRWVLKNGELVNA
jgi:hypothetical protein